MRTTKVVATIGPACHTPETLGRLFSAGLDVVRFNMSHGDHEVHGRALSAVNEAVSKAGLHVARMADLCGPKVRTCEMDASASEIARGARATIVREMSVGTAARFGTNCTSVVDDVDVGHRVLIDDGSIVLRVTEKERDALFCECDEGGVIGSHKGVNVPDSNLSLASLTEKDHADLRWAIDHDFDYVALSFVRRPDDVRDLRDALGALGAKTPIVSKIETPQAIASLDEIILESDAVLVARGDLGVEMDISRIPMLQKDIVRRCRVMGKPVIVATQMLQSMVEQASPTRAEVSDVANAVFDGADAVMLSAESAVGKYPVQSVQMMNRICAQAQAYRTERGGRRSDRLDERLRVGHQVNPTRSSVAQSAVLVAHDADVKLVIVLCRSGLTAQWMSKYRMRCPIAAISADASVCRRLALSHGLHPYLIEQAYADGTAPWRELESRLIKHYGLSSGDAMVIVGDPSAQHRESTITIQIVGDR